MWLASVAHLASCPFHYISRHGVMNTSPVSSYTTVRSVSYRVRSKRDVDFDVVKSPDIPLYDGRPRRQE